MLFLALEHYFHFLLLIRLISAHPSCGHRKPSLSFSTPSLGQNKSRGQLRLRGKETHSIERWGKVTLQRKGAELRPCLQSTSTDAKITIANADRTRKLRVIILPKEPHSKTTSASSCDLQPWYCKTQLSYPPECWLFS